MRDDEWKAVEGAKAADKAAMRFFKVVVGGCRGGAARRDGSPHRAARLGQNAPGTLDLWIVAKGGGAELCHIDWFAFSW